MFFLKSRLALSLLSLSLLLSCAAPTLQPPVVQNTLDTSKVASVQAKVAEDEEELLRLTQDPKAYLKAEGIEIPADQQVKVLEVGTKIYLVLDDRSLALLHPGVNTPDNANNPIAKTLGSIRSKAASDNAYKSELLKNTAQVLIKEGLSEMVAEQFEVIDYQPNVNLLMVSSEAGEVNRGTSNSDWDLSLWKVEFNKQVFSAPLAFQKPLLRLLNEYARGKSFTNRPLHPYQQNLIAKMSTELGNIQFVTCAGSGTLANIDYCVAYFKNETSTDTIELALLDMLKNPKAYPANNFKTTLDYPQFKLKFTDLLLAQKKLGELEAQEKKAPSKILNDQILNQLRIMEEICNSLIANQATVNPGNDKVGFDKSMETIKTLLNEVYDKLLKREETAEFNKSLEATKEYLNKANA